MKEDMTREVSLEVSDAGEAPKMDRRSFLLALSGGALALTATGLLAGCGGGGTNGDSFSGGSSSTGLNTGAGQYSGSVDLGNGQTGALALTVAAGGQANGTLTVSQPVQANTIPAGTYPVNGTINAATGAYTASATIPTVGAVSVTGTLPTGTSAGAFSLAAGGQTYNGTLAAGSIMGGSSSSSGTSSSSSSSSSSGTGGTMSGVTSSTMVNSGGGNTTILTDSSGAFVARLVAAAGFPSTTVSALAVSALPSAATVPSGKTLVSPYIIKVVANGANVGNATLTLPYTGTHTTDIAFVSDGASPFVPGAYGIRTSGGTEDIEVSSGGGLDIAYNSITSSYGNTGYVGLFA